MLPKLYSRRGLLALLLSAVIIAGTACTEGSQPPESVADSAPALVAVASSAAEPVMDHADIEPEPQTVITSGSSVQTEPVEVAESTEPAASSTEDFITEEPPTAELTTAPSTTAATSATEAVTTATTVATTTTAATEQPKPAALIVIPDVLTVSATGERAENCDRAVIDYSNSHLGYIGAGYSGSSDRAKLRIVSGGVTYDHDLDVGGEVQFFPLSQGSGDYQIQIYERIDGKNYGLVLELNTAVSIGDEISMYLYPNKYVSFDKGSSCVYKAAEVCAGVDGTVPRLAAIFEYVTNSITYDYDLAATVKSGYIPDPDGTLAKGSGICFDYASLVAAMARSQGIPTRLVVGYAADNIYHAWNEVYTDETGWISAELLLAQRGFNIVDATFYAGAQDKAAIAQYISDSGNYAAIFRY